MSDTASCLAVVEKKPQKAGGCVGIFFQLFDWNRKFAKKKLFSKKLLPPVRFRKFGGDEKQPKLRLIADENSGGFPSAKNCNGGPSVNNEQTNDTRVPGLVARLMGLDSMPASHREKSKKLPPSAKPQKIVDNREELNVEKGGVKNELRPQKLQKTSVCERHPVTKFGAEKLPFKNVLSKSRKHHTKLPSPVKSPRNLSRKRSSKLIGAATRILEPGLHTSRSKCALTYHPREFRSEERLNSLSSQLEDCDGFGDVLMGESSCRNCGYSMNNPNCTKPLAFGLPFPNCEGSSSCSERNKRGDTAFYQELDEGLHGDSCKSPFTGQIQRHCGSQQHKPLSSAPLSVSPNYKAHKQNQLFRARERVPPRPNLTSVTNGTRDFVSASQNVSCSTRPRVQARMDNGRFELEKRVPSGMNDSVPPGRKRRPTNICRQGENSGFTVSGKQLGYDAGFVNHSKGRVGFVHGQDSTFNYDQGVNNVVSLAFNSPVKQKRGIHEAMERRVNRGLCCDDSLQKSALGEKSRKTKFENGCPISGDALGALLEQKLKELNSQGEDMVNAPKKTTAVILQELIAALTLEVPFQRDNSPAISDRRNDRCNQSLLSNLTSSAHSQANKMGMKLSVDLPLDSEHHLSPGSVIEAYFSTESCPSSSLDESLGYKFPNGSDCSNYEPQSPNPDSDFFNSTAESSKELVIDILNSVTEILCSSNLAFDLKGYKLDQAKEVLLNAELVFHTATLSGSVAGRNSPIKRLLLDELEMLASLLWVKYGCYLGVEDGKEANIIKTFVVDSIIEYLGVKFQGHPQRGYKLSRKLPLRVNNNMLMFEIVEVVQRWRDISRLGLDELIEREMSLSVGEWTECETEAFETGTEISRQLLQSLVDEIVMDLCC